MTEKFELGAPRNWKLGLAAFVAGGVTAMVVLAFLRRRARA